MKTPSPQLLFTIGIFLCVSISCKKIGCVSEWAQENDGPDNAAFDTDCLLGADPFVGTYTMHFKYDDESYYYDEVGYLHWYTFQVDLYDPEFKISVNATGDTFNLQTPVIQNNFPIPATLDNDTLRISHYVGTLVVRSFNGKAYFDGDSLRLKLNYHLSNWPPGISEHTEYSAAGLRRN